MTSSYSEAVEPPDYWHNYLRVPRSVRRALKHEPITLTVYLELVDRAAYRAGVRIIKGRTVHLELGQAVFGRDELAVELDVTPRQVRTAIEHLVTLGVISINSTDQSTSRGTLVTLLGYTGNDEPVEAERPAERPANGQPTTSQRPANGQPTTTNEDLRSEIGEKGKTGEVALTPQTVKPIGASSWSRRQAWWQAMLDAHRRLRDKGIKPHTPDLPKTPAGPNERNLIACEKQLRDAGDDDETIDRKMRHVVLVAEAEAARSDVRHLDWFIPALIWDPVRFARAVDTTLETARKGRTTPQRAEERPARRIERLDPI